MIDDFGRMGGVCVEIKVLIYIEIFWIFFIYEIMWNVL